MARIIRIILVLALVIMLALPLTACGIPTSQPSGSAFAPVALVDSSPFTIATIYDARSDYRDRYQKDMDYLQELLKQRGWNIKLKLESAVPDEDTGAMPYGDVLQQDAASGSLADGYQLQAADARELAKTGLIRNLDKIVKDTAPVLYDRYRVYFEQDGSGIPTFAFRDVWGKPTVLYLKKSVAEGAAVQPTSMTGILSLMESEKTLKIGFNLGLSFNSVTEALRLWAGEQGYYALEYCGIRGDLYAAYGDPECAPAPIESIPGFYAAFDQILRLFDERRFFDLGISETNGEDASGYVGPLNGEMYQSFLARVKATGKDFLSYPLQGCGVPRLPAYDPYVHTVLASPVLSRKTEQLILFSLWAQTEQDGYGLLRYGAKDVDYRLDDDRVEFLNKGKVMTEQDWDPMSSAAYVFHAPVLLYSETMERVTIYAADNYMSLAGGMQPIEPPIFTVKALRVPRYMLRGFFDSIYDEFNNAIGDRDTFLSGDVYTGDRNQERGNAEKCLAGLKAMEKDTTRLVEAYRQKIWQLLHEKE